jgi:hypothetical protein
MKCANCSKDAMYIYEINAKTSIPYCDKDLPLFLVDRKKAGLLKTTAEHATALKEVATNLSQTSSSLDDSTQSAPEPKKATKKKAE